MKKTALFIGRFQPFHNGHLDAIKQIFAEEDIKQLIIVVGSAENDYFPDNPFTAGERITMIKAALKKAEISGESYQIIPLRDINQYSMWTRHVQRYTPDFDCIYSGSEIVRYLFKKDNFDAREQKLNIKINATSVREALLKDSGWQKMIPPAVAEFLIKLNAPERMRVIFEKDHVKKFPKK